MSVQSDTVLKALGLGASATTEADYGQQGALRDILTQTSGSAANADKAIALANQLVPQAAKADPWEAAFQFFAEMGKQASVPGATALGSAVSSMSVPFDYLQAKKAERRETEQARMKTALSLGPSLKPKEKTATQLNYKSVMITKPDGTSYEDYIPTSQIAGLQAKGFTVLAKSPSKTGSVTKPFDVKITNLTAFNKEFPKVTLPTDSTIPLTSAELAKLPMGSYEFPDTSKSASATKPFSIEILDDAAFSLKFPTTKIPADKIISLDSEDADLLPIGSYKLYNKPKTFAEKYLQQGKVVYAKNDIEAKKILSDLGVGESDTEYASLLASITTDDEELFGKPVIIADEYVNFYKPVNSELFNVIIRSPSGGATPPEVISRNAEIKALIPMQLTQQSIARELIPTLEGALTILMNDPDITGAFPAKTMSIRNFMSSAFGFTDAELESQKYLSALSNKLAPKMRPVGSGSTSDMEFKAYKQAILDMDNPARTNYLTMYSLKRTTEAAIEEFALKKLLLNQGKSETYIANKILERPATIYEKFTTTDEDGNDLYQEGDEAKFIADREAWFDSLPRGTVILNKDTGLQGKKIYPLSEATLIIKGWKGVIE